MDLHHLKSCASTRSVVVSFNNYHLQILTLVVSFTRIEFCVAYDTKCLSEIHLPYYEVKMSPVVNNSFGIIIGETASLYACNCSAYDLVQTFRFLVFPMRLLSCKVTIIVYMFGLADKPVSFSFSFSYNFSF